MFQRAFLEDVQKLDIVEGKNQQNVRSNLPEYISSSFFHEYMMDVHAAEVNKRITEAVSNMYENLVPTARFSEKGGRWIYWAFDPGFKVWQRESDVVFNRFFTAFVEYSARTLTKYVVSEKLVEAVWKASFPKDTLQNITRPSCREDFMLDTIEYFLLVRDIKGNYRVFDMIEGELVTPTASHECSGKHAIQLSAPFDELSKRLDNPSLGELLNVLYFDETIAFTASLKRKLTSETELFEDSKSYAEWTKIYLGHSLSLLEAKSPKLYAKFSSRLLNEMMALHLYFSQMCKFNSALMSYLVSRLASAFVKGNSERKLIIWSGIGSNGKTHLMQLLQRVLGSYATRARNTVFSVEKDHDDTLANNLFTACLLTIDELSHIDASLLKKFTSHGSFNTRAIYKGAVSADIKCQFLAALNTFPSDSLDQAALLRVICIPFKAKFVDPEDVSLAISEQIDKSMFCKSDNGAETSMRLPFLCTMLGILRMKLDTSTGRVMIPKMPKMVEDETNLFRRKCDSYFRFLEEYRVEEVLNTETTLASVRDCVREFTKNLETQQLDTILRSFVENYKQKIMCKRELQSLGLELRHILYLLDTNYELLTKPVKLRRRVLEEEKSKTVKAEVEKLMSQVEVPRYIMPRDVEVLIVFNQISIPRLREKEELAQQVKRAGASQLFSVFDQVKRSKTS
ncbi:putative helicase [Halotydeus destructor]|nr:putative helicase [Halotydeus destructor]